METRDIREALDALASAGMKDADVLAWLKSRHNASSGIIPLIFPVVYKTGMNFEILPYLDLGRKGEVWGFEILSGIVLAKKCGEDGNVSETNWFDCKGFAESMFLNGKQGSLPSNEVLGEGWSEELRDNIQEMDELLCANGIDGEIRSADNIYYVGVLWCSEGFAGGYARCFSLKSTLDDWEEKENTYRYDRLAVAF